MRATRICKARKIISTNRSRTSHRTMTGQSVSRMMGMYKYFLYLLCFSCTFTAPQHSEQASMGSGSCSSELNWMDWWKRTSSMLVLEIAVGFGRGVVQCRRRPMLISTVAPLTKCKSYIAPAVATLRPLGSSYIPWRSAEAGNSVSRY